MIIDSSLKKWLQDFAGDNVKFAESMKKHTSFRVGGPAEAFITPDSMDQLFELFNYIFQRNIPYTIIGGGTNLLVKDSGIKGIVVKLDSCLNKILINRMENKKIVVSAGAGVKTNSLCMFAANYGLKGMNFAIGIPGTIGGAVIMNAGTSCSFMEDVIESITVLMPCDGTKPFQITKLNKNELDFGYRHLLFDNVKPNLYNKNPVIIDCSFVLKASDSLSIGNDIKKILKKRKKNQPINSLSAGCFFKNPESSKSAGELIELAGLKGKRVGDARVSEKHANFIINAGNATCEDILSLMRHIQAKVFDVFGIHLKPEVECIGI